MMLPQETTQRPTSSARTHPVRKEGTSRSKGTAPSTSLQTGWEGVCDSNPASFEQGPQRISLGVSRNTFKPTTCISSSLKIGISWSCKTDTKASRSWQPSGPLRLSNFLSAFD